MNFNSKSIIGRVHDSERGQALVLVPTILVALLAAAAFVIDMGNLYLSQEELQSAATAAAAAGAAGIPQGDDEWQTLAYQYSGWTSAPGVTSVYNLHKNMTVTSVAPSLACVEPTTYPNLGLPPCSIYSGNTAATCNASTGCNVI